jgi:hypothetical protein
LLRLPADGRTGGMEEEGGQPLSAALSADLDGRRPNCSRTVEAGGRAGAAGKALRRFGI